MRKLIDADDVISLLANHHFDGSKENTDLLIHNLCKEVKSVPTAYDLDKVVRQLEEIRPEEDCFDDVEEYKYALSNHNKIIEIVKGGVADLDFECEWHLEDAEGNLYATECENRQLIFEGTPKENGYRYCPYCGRKIKEVE